MSLQVLAGPSDCSRAEMFRAEEISEIFRALALQEDLGARHEKTLLGHVEGEKDAKFHRLAFDEDWM